MFRDFPGTENRTGTRTAPLSISLSLSTGTETQRKSFPQTNRPDRKPEPSEPFHTQNVTNRTEPGPPCFVFPAYNFVSQRFSNSFFPCASRESGCFKFSTKHTREESFRTNLFRVTLGAENTLLSMPRSQQSTLSQQC